MDPNFYDLRYFLEVAHVRNMSRAAERIGITQPSLSQSIKRLEEATGSTLFLRSKKGVELTSAGQRLRGHAQLLLASWETLKRTAKNATDEVAGVLRLGCHASVALYTLHHFLPTILKAHPGVDVQLTHDLSRKITDQVIQFQLDMGIVVNPTPHPDLIIKRLTNDVVTIWEAPGAPDILIYDPQLLQAQHILKKLRGAKEGFTREIQTTSLELATRLAATGAGRAVLPTRVVQENAEGKLKPMKNAPKFNDEIALIYRHENKGLKLIEAFSASIQKVFA